MNGALAIVHSRACAGIKAPPVTVEVHLSNGLPAFSIVGLPETAVKESKERVRSALINSRFEFPTRRITVNLAPADLPKDGGRFDLPIALGVLAASGQIPSKTLSNFEFTGELALSGELRPIFGALPLAIAVQGTQRNLVLPSDNAFEASFASRVSLFPARHLLEVCAHLLGTQALTPYTRQETLSDSTESSLPDLSEVRGQSQARRALEIAAAGQHSLLLFGSPGTGKTMLASRLISILPPLEEEEALETAVIASVAGKSIPLTHWRQRPFRAPHHTASSVALVGGGSPPKPGEISLAHRGVLFLDELPEFNRAVLEALREPLESGHVTISRASYQTRFPAHFQLVAAMNPCPCGFLGDDQGRCRCTKEQIRRYQGRISGPLLDRIDMQVQVPPLPQGVLSQRSAQSTVENSAVVRARVLEASILQKTRGGKPNASLMPGEIEQVCQLANSEQVLLDQAMIKFGLTARSYHRVLKVARTIADLAGSVSIQSDHLAESLSYRWLDRRC